MPRFFFHLVAAEKTTLDEEGVEFSTFEEAFIDAHRAAVDITCEMLRSRRDPKRLTFDVRDEAGRPVFELPFAEVVRAAPVSRSAAHRVLMTRIEESLDRGLELKGDIAAHMAKAAHTLQQIRAKLDLAKGSMRGLENM